MIPDLVIEDDRWAALGLDALAQAAFGAVARQLDVPPDAEVSLLACDDARIKILNAGFRAKDKATNVLSWPADDLSPDAPGEQPYLPEPDVMGELMLGDVAISYETCLREADEQAKPISAHVTHLLVHGCLHLLGYDHETDADATVMERLETEILGKMGLPDPYLTDSGGA
jgi:probable rRNA maturation factor